MPRVFKKTTHLLVLLPVTLALLLGRGAAQQDIPLTKATCSISDGQSSLKCHWQNTDMSCTYNASADAVADSGTSCGTMSSNPSFGTVVETTTYGSCTTTAAEACVTSMPMNAQCEATSSQPFSVVTSHTGNCGGGGGPPPCGPSGTIGPDGVCQCPPDGGGCSPIIVDTTGGGFHLTSADDGVVFDIKGDGHPIKLSWTAGNSGNAFLALDRNHNGKIDNGKELFGNFTEQPPCPDGGRSCLNGYRALAEFDKPEKGGNGDGIIDSRDAVFSHLLLWIDENHDGISQPNELHTLPELGVYSINLHYREDRHYFDQYGNWFHYQAALNPDPQDGESKDGRMTYDVFFVFAAPQKAEEHQKPAGPSPEKVISQVGRRSN